MRQMFFKHALNSNVTTKWQEAFLTIRLRYLAQLFVGFVKFISKNQSKIHLQLSQVCLCIANQQLYVSSLQVQVHIKVQMHQGSI